MTIKLLKRYIIYFLPNFLKKILKKYRDQRNNILIKKRFKKTRMFKEEIIAIIERLNLDCDVFLHSSMSSIGYVNCSTKYISDYLLEKVDVSRNTLLSTAMPFKNMSSKVYLEENKIFDVRSALVETGAINKYLSLHQKAERSLHPTHSVVAIGPKSSYYTSEHYLDQTPFGIHSPYFKLIESNAKILMLGAGINYLTFMHVIEDILGEFYPINPYLKKRYTIELINMYGSKYTMETCCHNPFKRVKLDINNLLPYFIKFNAIERYTIGESEISVLDAKKVIYANYMALLEGVCTYGKFKLKRELKEKILENIKELK
jgi:aminoglycoside 3-N-acetyltransferase